MKTIVLVVVIIAEIVVRNAQGIITATGAGLKKNSMSLKDSSFALIV